MRLLALLLLAVALAGPPEAESCGPFLPSAQFSFVSQPPPDVFARGQLGILRPGYYRRYLVVAFRYLTGVPLNAEEAAAFDSWQTSVPPTYSARTPADLWIQPRNRIPGVAGIERIDQFRQLAQPSYQSYENCLDDAFARAAQTLAERTTTWGAGSSLLKQWVSGQDAVFRNCSDGDTAPPDLSADADSLLRADHQYQVAAAEFYSEHYEAAERDFEAIAHADASPWQDMGEYMVARTMIRKSSVAGVTGQLQRAELVLDGIIANPQLAKRRAAAQALKEFVSVV